jgi:hypothetical protein
MFWGGFIFGSAQSWFSRIKNRHGKLLTKKTWIIFCWIENWVKNYFLIFFFGKFFRKK